MEESTLLLIDGSGLLSTHYYGNLPRQILFAKTKEEKERYYGKIMQTSGGVYTNAVYGFLRALFKILKDQKPAYLAVLWDLTRDTFRREKYPLYKSNRDETPKPLADQFALCQDVLKRIGVRQFMSTTYEADDYAGTLAKRFESEVPVRILTKDRDYLQLVNNQTHLWMLVASEEKKTELFQKYHLDKDSLNIPDKTFELDPDRVLSEYEIRPDEVTSLKGLEGDPSDHIPGVPGVGHQTAVKLIREYHSVEALYQTLHEKLPAHEEELKAYWKETLLISRPPFSALLKPSGETLYGEDSATLSKDLATIRTDIDLPGLTLSDLKTAVDKNAAADVLRELEIHSIDLSFETEEDAFDPYDGYREINDLTEAEAFIGSMKNESLVGVSYKPGAGLALSSEKAGNALLIPFFLLNEQTFSSILSLLKTSGVRLASFSSKQLVKSFDIDTDDVAIAAYLLDPLSGNYAADTLLASHLGVRTELPADEKKLAYLDAVSARMLHPVLMKKLKEAGMERLYTEIELPTMRSLAEMEEVGIRIDRDELDRFSVLLKEKTDALSDEIHTLAGEDFNINSPKQLSSVLFEKLAIPYGKKPKSGYSTAADVLERFRDDYPIVDKVLEYRQYAKLRSTYAEGLKSFISPDGRIHGTFHQTVTATGRISSANPNLQNIPVRTELGQEFRKLFIPKDGCVFVDADFSQIELRVLAALSGDKNLTDAFLSGKDVHTNTASLVFNVPEEEVTKEERRRAKAVNFGIVYGISAHSLSDDLKISYEEADSYMKSYFRTYPLIREYLDRTVREAEETGVVRTLFGRIRPIPEILSSNYNVHGFGIRAAMNSPIQGTAADLMKIAVIRVGNALKQRKMASKIVLQVHDEILLECPKDEAEEAKKLLQYEMEHAYEMTPPLKADAKTGGSWYETK